MRVLKFEEQMNVQSKVGAALIEVAKINHVLEFNERLTAERRKELSHDLKRNMDVLANFWQSAAQCEYASIDEGEFELAEDENLQVPIIVFSNESE